MFYLFLGNIWLILKGSYQRIMYGVSDQDLWSFDIFLAHIIIRGLEKIKKDQAYPGYLQSYDQWVAILTEIQFAFALHIRSFEHNIKMTQIEQYRYDNGMRMFILHLPSFES